VWYTKSRRIIMKVTVTLSLPEARYLLSLVSNPNLSIPGVENMRQHVNVSDKIRHATEAVADELEEETDVKGLA
jgi:hypothetical protein